MLKFQTPKQPSDLDIDEPILDDGWNVDELGDINDLNDDIVSDPGQVQDRNQVENIDFHENEMSEKVIDEFEIVKKEEPWDPSQINDEVEGSQPNLKPAEDHKSIENIDQSKVEHNVEDNKVVKNEVEDELDMNLADEDIDLDDLNIEDAWNQEEFGLDEDIN